MRLPIVLPAFLLLLCLWPLVRPETSLAADKQYTTLTIAVVDEARDRPVPKASVTVTFVKGRKMLVKKVRSEWNTKTNGKGLAEMPEIPSGPARLQVIAPGFQTFGDEIELSGNEQTVTVKLKRPSGSQTSAHEQSDPKKPQ